MDWKLASSLVLNIVLVFLLFFKSSLNSMVLEWWKEKRNKESKRKEKLNDLRVQLDKLSRYYFLLILRAKEQKNDPTLLNNKKFMEQHSELTERIGTILEHLSKNEIHYPQQIRTEIQNFKTKNTEYLTQVLKGTNLVSLKEFTDIMETELSKITTRIEEKIF